MKLLKYICLALVLLNLPAVSLSGISTLLGSLLSYATIGLLAVYYFFEEKSAPNWFLGVISVLFFLISSLTYDGPTFVFILDAIKYFIYLLGGYALVKHTTTTEFYIFFLIGSVTVPLEALLYTSDFGRYAGFYLNPNVAGFICITGYASTYGLKNVSLKLIGQFLFTLSGLLTFSRTFIVIWLLINLISLKISIKNIRIFGLGFLIISTLFFIDEVVGLNNPRFESLKAAVNNEGVSSEEVSEDSRADTWAKFYDKIFSAPIIGNGYGTFSGKEGNGLGVHNSYLMIVGESGVLPFFLFLGYMIFLMIKSLTYFNKKPNLIMQFIALSLFLLANHNFFTFYYVSFAAMWIQYQIEVAKKEFKDDENHYAID